MSYRDLQKRFAALEQTQQPAADGARFVVDIGGEEARYWIDGREVSGDKYARRVPDGPYYVDLGDDDEL